MSDNENNAANMSAHGDFDYSLVYRNFSREVPDLEDIQKAAKQFGDSHRYLINQLVLEPSMNIRKMNMLFTLHYVFTVLKRHPSVAMQIDISESSVRKLAKTIVKTMNNEKGIGGFRPWRFVISSDEISPEEFVTMTGCCRSSNFISEASEITKSERALLLAVLEEMICSNGTVPMSWIHAQIREDPCKMTFAKCDVFMTSMLRQKYFNMDQYKEIVQITPRLVVELEPYIRTKFGDDLRICELCRKIIARPLHTAKCKRCNALSHYNCFKSATVITNQDSVECQKCNEKNFLIDVENHLSDMKALRSRATSRIESASASSPRMSKESKTPDSGVENINNKESDSDGDVDATRFSMKRGRSGAKIIDSDSD